jgi:hypothetical protein
VNERTYRVSFTSKDAPDVADPFFRYSGDSLPEEGDIIGVTRFVRGRRIRARVTHVDPNASPPIEAVQID